MSTTSDAQPGVTTGRYDIPAFIADVERVVASGVDEQSVAAAVAAHLPRLLTTPALLAPEHRQTSPDGYRVHIVAVAPSRAFTITSLVWLPGQCTAIHDHICWCVVGTLQGIEYESRFRLLEDDGGTRWLCPNGEEMMRPGTVAMLLPPQENIHRVRNAGDTLAISLHIYGADLERVTTHSSINECFDHLPVRAATHGTPIPWRAKTDFGAAS